MIPLSPDTAERVNKLFPDLEDARVVAELLERECADNLPLWHGTTPEHFERIRYAVLKLSEGDLEKLNKAIAIAKIDWRDSLVAAGFGHQVESYRWWVP
ncbi:MAG TPA: hypothetical protein VGK19_01635 [Capsulimonadaceae bacterium]|jgi:hypothetical protein